jgi:soluble lytic murein transglycosylase
MNMLVTALVGTLLWTAPGPTPGPLETSREWLRAGKTSAAFGLLASTWPTLERAEDRQQARYLLGRELIKRGSAAGLEHIEALPRPFGLLEDRRLVWRARGLALTDRFDEAILALESARSVAANKREQGELALERARIYLAAGRSDRALEIYEDLLTGTFERHHRATALGQIVGLTRATDSRRARRATRTLLIHLPETPEARSTELSYGPKDLSTRDRVKRARTLVQRFEYKEARDILRPLIEHTKHGSEARWLVGLIGIKKLRDAPEEARRLLGRVAKSKSEHAEEALFLLMRTFIKEDRYEEALAVGKRYKKRYPRGNFSARVAYYRAWLPYDERRCDVAVPRFKSYLKRFKYRRTYALGFVGWCGIRDGKWKTAVEDYEGLAGVSGALHQGKAWFWQAYALDKLGRRDAARSKLAKLNRVYPLTWYAMHGRQMAARWDGADPRASALPWPGGGALGERLSFSKDTWSWPNLSQKMRRKLDRVRALVVADEVDLARALYTPIREKVERGVSSRRREAFVRFMGHAVDDHKHGWALATGRRLSGLMALPQRADERWALGYPKAYEAIVEHGAPTRDIPPIFVYSIMRQESRYHPSMISAMDAIGALQMIPQTATLVGEATGQTYDPVTFADPRVGFPFSFFYMGEHAKLWRRQWSLVAASYNAGPAPVIRWVEENPGASLAWLVEEFSYNEARAYTRKVSEHLLRYLWLYVPEAQDRAPILDQLFPLEVLPPDPEVEVY